MKYFQYHPCLADMFHAFQQPNDTLAEWRTSPSLQVMHEWYDVRISTRNTHSDPYEKPVPSNLHLLGKCKLTYFTITPPGKFGLLKPPERVQIVFF